MNAQPIPVSDQQFRSAVLEADRPVLVDFWAPWCGPCRILAPVLEELAAEFGDRLTVAQVDTDRDAQLAVRHGVQGIPTLVLFQGGREVERVVGAHPKRALAAWLAGHLGA